MSLQKRLNSFRYAAQGLADLFRSQPNARIHLLAACVAVGLGFYFSVSQMEWLAIIACIAAVLAAEAFNTALEYLTDLTSPHFHPLAGKAKDAAAAGVLVAALGAAVIGFIIFGPRIVQIFKF